MYSMTMLLAYSDMAVLAAVVGLYAVLGALWCVHWIIQRGSTGSNTQRTAEQTGSQAMDDVGREIESRRSKDQYRDWPAATIKRNLVSYGGDTDEVAELRAELITVRETANRSRTHLLKLEEELEAVRLRVADLEREDAASDEEFSEAAHVLSLYEPHLAKYDDEWAAADPDLGVILARRPERPDDLTQIRGVGSVNQEFLNQHGVFYFQQIADWTKHNIDQFNELLAFKGRIEREDWVAQAKLLATQTPGRKAA